MLNKFAKLVFIGYVSGAFIFAAGIGFAAQKEGAIIAKERTASPSSLNIRVMNGLVYGDIRDTKIVQVIQEIGRQAKIEITIDENIKGKISLKFDGLPVEKALKQVCGNRAIVYEYDPTQKTFRVVKAGAYVSQDSSAHKAIIYENTKQTKDVADKVLVSTDHNRNNDSLIGKASKNQTPAEKETDRRGRPMYKTRELLIKFKPEVTKEQIAQINKKFGCSSIGYIKQFRMHKIQLPETLSERQAMDLYRSSGLVEVVERHALRYTNVIPNDPLYNDQWALPKIEAPFAWDFTTGNPEIVIAVIDTGVAYLHPDLSENIWTNAMERDGLPNVDDDGNGYVDDIYGWDFGDNDAFPDDLDGHGTHVAGIIAATGNNGIGVSGISWNIKIMALKVQKNDASNMEAADIIAAVAYAIDQGAHIVNCSFGGNQFSQIEYDAYNGLENNGILAVCAAGNGDENGVGLNTDLPENYQYPSGLELGNIISVAASGTDDALAEFSNYGPITVDLAAPGFDIRSTVPAYTYTDAWVQASNGSYPFQFQAVGMSHAGTTDDTGISGTIYTCGLGYPQDFPAGVSGNVALIERGELLFSEKVVNAQHAGAVAAIIYNNIEGIFSGTLMRPANWVPVVALSQDDGQQMAAYGNIQVNVINRPIDDVSFYSNYSGTSMAAPYVSGLAGLIKSMNPSLAYSEIIAIIDATVAQVPALSGLVGTGGRINAAEAVFAAGLPVDLSCDQRIGIEDAIVALQVITGLDPFICPAYFEFGIDIGDNGYVGMEEVLYILQMISNLR